MKLIFMLRFSRVLLFAMLVLIQIYFLIFQGDLFDIIPFLFVSIVIWLALKSRYFISEENDSDYILLVSFYFALTAVYISSTEKLVFRNLSGALAFRLFCNILIVINSIYWVCMSIESKSFRPVIKLFAISLLGLFFFFVPVIEGSAFIPRQLYAKYFYDVDISKVIIVKYSRDAVNCNTDSTTTCFRKPFYGYFYTQEEYIPGFGVCNPNFWMYQRCSNQLMISTVDQKLEYIFYRGIKMNNSLN